MLTMIQAEEDALSGREAYLLELCPAETVMFLSRDKSTAAWAIGLSSKCSLTDGLVRYANDQ